MNAETGGTTGGECGDDSVATPADETVENASGAPPPAGASSQPTEQPTRVILDREAVDRSSLDELRSYWYQQNSYIDALEASNANLQAELRALKEAEEKLKATVSELALRERVLVRRLAAKEQDMHEYAGQLSEMKGGQALSAGGLRSALVDPAVNILVQKLREELAATRTRLDDTQNELAAWKFTPDSNTGKRLMAKCRLLYQENEELGRMVSSGRLAKLEGDLALQKSFSEEVKKSQSDLDELLQDLDEDVEGMQSTIYYLQQELRKAKDATAALEREYETLKGRLVGGNTTDIESATLTPQPLNGMSSSIAGHHNGKWNDEEEEEDKKKKNDRVESGDTVDGDSLQTESLTRDDSVVVVNNEHHDNDMDTNTSEQQRTPNSENGDQHEPPPPKKSKTEHTITTTTTSTTIITNGDVTTQ